MPGYLAHPLGEGVLLADIAAPAVPRGGEIIHELTHHYMSQVLGTSRPELANGANAFPRLVHEGLAEALRWRWVGEASGGGRDSLRYLWLVRTALRSGTGRGVRDILTFNGYINRMRPEDAAHFAHGWALASFLLARPEGPGCLRKFVEGVKPGGEPVAAFGAAVRGAFGMTPEAFESEWKAWVDERWEARIRDARRVLDADPAKAEEVRLNAEALGAADWAEREAAGRRLVALGDRAFPVLFPLFDHEDVEVRTRARAVFESILAP
jgi:hypothetical protein